MDAAEDWDASAFEIDEEALAAEDSCVARGRGPVAALGAAAPASQPAALTPRPPPQPVCLGAVVESESLASAHCFPGGAAQGGYDSDIGGGRVDFGTPAVQSDIGSPCWAAAGCNSSAGNAAVEQGSVAPPSSSAAAAFIGGPASGVDWSEGGWPEDEEPDIDELLHASSHTPRRESGLRASEGTAGTAGIVGAAAVAGAASAAGDAGDAGAGAGADAASVAASQAGAPPDDALVLASQARGSSQQGWAPASKRGRWAAVAEPKAATAAGRDDEEVLKARCRREGPPGPASSTLVVSGAGSKVCVGAGGAVGCGLLGENVAWLAALQALKLPLDRFHLGAGGFPAPSSPMGTHNLASVTKSIWPPKRWHLLVLVRSVEMIAGEISALVADPTGEARATIDRHVPMVWPHVATEGSVLLLTNVVAVPPLQTPARGAAEPRRHPRLLVMERSLGRCFAQRDASPEEAAKLLAEAKAGLAGSAM